MSVEAFNKESWKWRWGKGRSWQWEIFFKAIGVLYTGTSGKDWEIMKEIFKQIHRYKEQDFEEGKPFEFTLDKAIKEGDTNGLGRETKETD